MPNIIKFEAQNVKRLRAVRIIPGKGPVVIGGNNAQGKTSILDAIEMTLGGKDSICERPIRDGQNSAHVVIETDEYTITRKFSAAGGTTLTVCNKDGIAQKSPQGILDSLTAKISFDPLEFTRMKPAEQAAQLRALVNLDVSGLEAEEKKAYDARTEVNRDAEKLKHALSLTPESNEAPDAEVSLKDLTSEYQIAVQKNSANQSARNSLAEIEQRISRHSEAEELELQTIKSLEEKLEAAKGRLKEAQKKTSDAKAELEKGREAIAKLIDIDISDIQSRISNAESQNAAFRRKQERLKLQNQLAEKSSEALTLTSKIEDLKAQKQKKLDEVKFPVEGLSLDAGEVQFNKIPLKQASAAEQLRVSIAIACAMNPKLKVMLIRDGSLLDENSMKLLVEEADKAGAQIWIEVVGNRSDCSVVIEDGEIQSEQQSEHQ